MRTKIITIALAAALLPLIKTAHAQGTETAHPPQDF